MAIRFDFDLDVPLAESVFVQDGQHLVIRRVSPRACIIWFDGAAPQQMQFDDHREALSFYSNLESELARTGWTLMDVRPTRPSALYRSRLLADSPS